MRRRRLCRRRSDEHCNNAPAARAPASPGARQGFRDGGAPAPRRVPVEPGQHLKKFKGSKSEQAKEVGKLLAANAEQAGVETVVFDRGGYLYHGRVKALAEGAREGGLKF